MERQQSTYSIFKRILNKPSSFSKIVKGTVPGNSPPTAFLLPWPPQADHPAARFSHRVAVFSCSVQDTLPVKEALNHYALTTEVNLANQEVGSH